MPTGKQYQFRVKAGTHLSKGRVYKTGEVVTSDKDLAKTFKEKFEKVDVADPAPLVAVGSKQDGAVTERPTTSTKAPITPKGAGRALVTTEEEAKAKQESDPEYDSEEEAKATRARTSRSASVEDDDDEDDEPSKKAAKSTSHSSHSTHSASSGKKH